MIMITPDPGVTMPDEVRHQCVLLNSQAHPDPRSTILQVSCQFYRKFMIGSNKLARFGYQYERAYLSLA